SALVARVSYGEDHIKEGNYRFGMAMHLMKRVLKWLLYGSENLWQNVFGLYILFCPVYSRY
ncbi:MAG: hypothetical protein P8175_15140, partial [Deltaproteobacteria bacterium]